MGGVVLRVPAEQAEEARRVIEEHLASPGAEMEEPSGEPEAGS